MKLCYLLLLVIFIIEIPKYLAKNTQKNVIDDIIDLKDFKKLIKIKKNVMVCFTISPKKSSQVIKIFLKAAVTIKGTGTMVLINCRDKAKKLCKSLKISPESEPYIFKHYKDGEFHKDYDRAITVSSIIFFMRNPTGDLPWEEDPTANNVIHIANEYKLEKFTKKELRPTMVLFYSSRCTKCAKLSEFAQAASELRGSAVFVAMDVAKPENLDFKIKHMINTCTLLFFQDGEFQYQYEGDDSKDGLVSFMMDPSVDAMKKLDWSDSDSHVIYMNNDNLDEVLKFSKSAIVFFYNPGNEHCKRMKLEYEKAAARMISEDIPGILVATKDSYIARMFNVRLTPTLKYFIHGDFKFDINISNANEIIEFMKDPKDHLSSTDAPSEVFDMVEDTFIPFLKKKTHVLVLFYDHSCGLCNQDEFRAAAEEFKNNPEVEFESVDCTVHQSICGVNDVKDYPTFKYFNNVHKNTKTYNGGLRSVDFIRYMSDPENPVFLTIEPEEEERGPDDDIILNDYNFSSMKSISSLKDEL